MTASRYDCEESPQGRPALAQREPKHSTEICSRHTGRHWLTRVQRNAAVRISHCHRMRLSRDTASRKEPTLCKSSFKASPVDMQKPPQRLCSASPSHCSEGSSQGQRTGKVCLSNPYCAWLRDRVVAWATRTVKGTREKAKLLAGLWLHHEIHILINTPHVCPDRSRRHQTRANHPGGSPSAARSFASCSG